ncbi:MAG: hypothetical protein HRU20_06180 [Pseudomonadales bacterium]|nr:hypothetical protein [Pseudomonadales bacterium]
MNEADVYCLGFRLNLALSYRWQEDLEFNLYLQNLVSVNDNKRYSYDTGNDDPAPRRVRYIQKPRSLSLALQYSF